MENKIQKNNIHHKWQLTLNRAGGVRSDYENFELKPLKMAFLWISSGLTHLDHRDSNRPLLQSVLTCLCWFGLLFPSLKIVHVGVEVPQPLVLIPKVQADHRSRLYTPVRHSGNTCQFFSHTISPVQTVLLSLSMIGDHYYPLFWSMRP